MSEKILALLILFRIGLFTFILVMVSYGLVCVYAWFVEKITKLQPSKTVVVLEDKVSANDENNNIIYCKSKGGV